MTGLGRWHVGPWTTRGTRSGEVAVAGRRRTVDELNFDVVGLARILGRRLSGRDELQVRLWQNELRPTHTRQCGVHTLADPSNAQLLHDTAQEALAWLGERAPAGYEFVLTDAVELRPLLDLSAPVVAVDAVVVLADVPLPAARLATAHVRRGATGDWYAGDAVCNWSGPHTTSDEAVAVVQQARAELVEQLRAAGRDDLAATAERWPTVPVESD
ncbi:hypothetical protein [Kribbella speibonae]|uniref:Uncharacterized protein n=1 Tax=Kribbella speibonae TaxID=1572660 RepID=A0A4V2M665_9ACTN|nr:hypothetical protein [Kribbella speibonae]TCC17394.1 hypothetical protein E0H58_37115 [Kribbella speibonae]TCC42462.1 hypothetical protein E0H92_12880 [Kribbella speibonae]